MTSLHVHQTLQNIEAPKYRNELGWIKLDGGAMDFLL